MKEFKVEWIEVYFRDKNLKQEAVEIVYQSRYRKAHTLDKSQRQKCWSKMFFFLELWETDNGKLEGTSMK